MIRFLIVLAALWLAGCNPTPPVPVSPAPDPCPSAGRAALEHQPTPPTLSAELRTALDVAIIRVLGADLAAALVRYQDAELPSWSDRQTARLAAMRDWCEGRDDGS